MIVIESAGALREALEGHKVEANETMVSHRQVLDHYREETAGIAATLQTEIDTCKAKATQIAMHVDIHKALTNTTIDVFQQALLERDLEAANLTAALQLAWTAHRADHNVTMAEMQQALESQKAELLGELSALQAKTTEDGQKLRADMDTGLEGAANVSQALREALDEHMAANNASAQALDQALEARRLEVDEKFAANRRWEDATFAALNEQLNATFAALDAQLEERRLAVDEAMNASDMYHDEALASYKFEVEEYRNKSKEELDVAFDKVEETFKTQANYVEEKFTANKRWENETFAELDAQLEERRQAVDAEIGRASCRERV